MMGKHILLLLLTVGIIVFLLVVPQTFSKNTDGIRIMNVKAQRANVYEYENASLLYSATEYLKKEDKDISMIIMPGVFSTAPMNCFADPDIDFLTEYGNPYWTNMFLKGVNDYDGIRACLSELTNESLCFRGIYVPTEYFMHTPDGWDKENAEEAGYIFSREGFIITREQPEKDLFVFHLEEGDFGVYFRENAKYELPAWYIRLKELYYGINIVEASTLRSKKTIPTVCETQEICLKTINTHRPYRWSIFMAIGLALVLSIVNVHDTLFPTIYKKRKDLLYLLIAISMAMFTMGIVTFVIEKTERIHSTGEGPIGYWRNMDSRDKTGNTISWELLQDGTFEIKTKEEAYYGLWDVKSNQTMSLTFITQNETYEQNWIYRRKETENGRLLNVYNPFGNVILRFESKGKSITNEEGESIASNVFVNIVQNQDASIEITVVDLREKDTAWITSIIGSELYMQIPITLPKPGKHEELNVKLEGHTFIADVFEDSLSIYGVSLNMNIYAFDYRYFDESLLESVYKYVIDCEPGENIKLAPIHLSGDKKPSDDESRHNHCETDGQ